MDREPCRRARLPGALQIVDLDHAKGHLWTVAKAIDGAGRDLGDAWAKHRRDALDEGQLDAVLRALAVHAEHHAEARQCLGYVTRNRNRLRDPEFRDQGFCTSTGVVEAGCQVAIGTRGTRAGLPGTVAGADADHRAALLHAQRPLRGLLGTAISHEGGGRVTASHKS